MAKKVVKKLKVRTNISKVHGREPGPLRKDIADHQRGMLRRLYPTDHRRSLAKENAGSKIGKTKLKSGKRKKK